MTEVDSCGESMSTQKGSTQSGSTQSAAAVMMVRPSAFGWNAQTAPSNRFQAMADAGGDAAVLARAECDALAAALAGTGVEVYGFDDRAEPACPDAVFPNNWVSLHADGTVVLYPMLAANRRLERRLELLVALGQRGGYRVTRLLDLTHHERHDRCLEGTGSVVFDHVARIGYACRSPRTDTAVLDELCAELGYTPMPFDATDGDGVPVYHTNVLLSIGSGFALVCAEAVVPAQRDALLEQLGRGGRRVLAIGRKEMADFAGNVLELRGTDGARLLAASARAMAGLSAPTRTALERCVDNCIAVPVPVIETIGGGSVRCMLAEVFLPRAPSPS